MKSNYLKNRVLKSLCRENLTMLVILEIEKSWIGPGCILLTKINISRCSRYLFFHYLPGPKLITCNPNSGLI